MSTESWLPGGNKIKKDRRKYMYSGLNNAIGCFNILDKNGASNHKERKRE